jgi:hypothetical protein
MYLPRRTTRRRCWTPLFLLVGPAVFMAHPANAKTDFAGLAICSKLKAIPKSAKFSKCDIRQPLRGQCRFSAKSGPVQIDYLLGNAVVLEKSVKIGANSAPYSLKQDDTVANAARKLEVKTGLDTTYWDDVENPTIGYLQSSPVGCGAGKTYSIYIWFENNTATHVSASTLPPL